DDPRFDRPGRGRPDPSGGRAPPGPARDPEHARDAAGRCDRDGGVLAARARDPHRSDRARAQPPEPADHPPRRRQQPQRPRRLHPGRRDGRPDPADRLGLRGAAGAGRTRSPGERRAEGRRRIDAVVGAVRPPERQLSQPGHGRRRHGSCSLRGGQRLRLGALARCKGRLCGNDGLRRVSEGGRLVQALWHHGRGDRLGGAPAGPVARTQRRRTMAVRVAINGFGRIGRNVLRAILESGRKDIEVVAINDLGPVETNAHLLRFDSVHGRFPHEVKVDGDTIDVGRGKMKVTAERDPSKLPHKAMGVEIALECTGIFTSKKAASAHLDAGAKRVLVSAPADGADLTVVYGVNHDKLTKDHVVVSNASCTTNCLAPVAKVLNDAVGIDKGFMTTIHAYTGDQPTLDTMHKDLYRARAAAMSMIPTSTGAAKAVGLVLPELKGKLDGVSIRVPTPNVSVIDFKFVSKRNVTVDEVNAVLVAAADGPLKGILAYTKEPLVSIDLNHNPASSTFALDQTKVIEGNLVRVMSWYDNEWGFSNRMSDTAVAFGKTIA